MKKFAVILAGGEGRRHGGSVPKQFAPLGERTVLWWAIHQFLEADPSTQLIVVMHPGMFDDFDIMMDGLPEADRPVVTLSCGGRSRTESVANGLLTIREILFAEGAVWPRDFADCLVAVHDAARPLVSPDLIRRGWEAAAPGIGAVPVVKPTASLRRLSPGGEERESTPVNRDEYREVQTPQVFIASDIINAYQPPLPDNCTDDASLAQQRGLKIRLFEGEYTNIKITNPLDSAIAELILGAKSV